MVERRRSRLTAQDWADAALDAMREGGGLAAIAVEPLAARLGTTKGSFYWHFPNREALVRAALARWEELSAEAITAKPAAEPSPEARLRRLLAEAAAAAAEDPIEFSLLAHTGHPRVAAVLRRVTESRISYVAKLFTEMGFPEDKAHRRGLLTYCVCLGQAQLAHSVPDALPDGAAARRYLDSVLAAVLGPETVPKEDQAEDRQ